MTQIQPFDAKAWIITRAPGVDIHKCTLEAVSNFTLMWNLFENLACDTHADIDKLVALVNTIAEASGVPADIAAGLQYWRNRYWVAGRFNSLFEGLNFRNGDRRKLVERVLSGNAANNKESNLAALIIVYRLRNNLFHGLKTVAELNEQIENLDTASRVLASALDVFVL